jgi:hypothetical protein
VRITAHNLSNPHLLRKHLLNRPKKASKHFSLKGGFKLVDKKQTSVNKGQATKKVFKDSVESPGLRKKPPDPPPKK